MTGTLTTYFEQLIQVAPGQWKRLAECSDQDLAQARALSAASVNPLRRFLVERAAGQRPV